MTSSTAPTAPDREHEAQPTGCVLPPLVEDWEGRSACLGADGVEFFPSRPAEYSEPVFDPKVGRPVRRFVRFLPGVEDGQAQAAKAVCRGCPVRLECLTRSVRVNDQDGIYGGAGGFARRDLRRAFVVDGEVSGPAWTAAVTAHFARLDGLPDAPKLNVNGPGARHGVGATFAKGCDCGPCSFAAGRRNALARVPRAQRSTQREEAA